MELCNENKSHSTSTAEDLAVRQITLSRWIPDYHACHFTGYKDRGRTEEEFADRSRNWRVTLELGVAEKAGKSLGWKGSVASPSDLCSSLLGPLAPHRRSPGSPPPAPGALPARGEAEGAVGEEVHSLGLSAGSQAWKDSRAQAVRYAAR